MTNGWDVARDAIGAVLAIVFILAFGTDFFNNIGKRRKG